MSRESGRNGAARLVVFWTTLAIIILGGADCGGDPNDRSTTATQEPSATPTSLSALETASPAIVDPSTAAETILAALSTTDDLPEGWTQTVAGEGDSVASFGELSSLLESSGAPPEQCHDLRQGLQEATQARSRRESAAETEFQDQGRIMPTMVGITIDVFPDDTAADAVFQLVRAIHTSSDPTLVDCAVRLSKQPNQLMFPASRAEAPEGGLSLAVAQDVGFTSDWLREGYVWRAANLLVHVSVEGLADPIKPEDDSTGTGGQAEYVSKELVDAVLSKVKATVERVTRGD